MTLKDFIKSRNKRIYHSFMIEGKRQKAIGMEEGLSESQVKHIIGKIRKELEK